MLPIASTSEARMSKILVLYYSAYGHIEKMAYAAAEGVKSGKAEAVVKRVPELVPEDVARKSGYKLDQPAPIATIDEDRKSTRLNSSHLGSSYAVFCLKKKR